MKKFIAMLLLLAIMLPLIACDKAEQAAAPDDGRVDLYSVNLDDLWAEYEGQKKEGELTPEEMYGHIDQTVPMGGIYKIWNAEGVKTIADHPDGKFEILCNIDMGGATLRPLGTKDQPFTGEIKSIGSNISNFKIEGSVDGCLGFIIVNKGHVNNLTLNDVTLVPDENTQYMGGIAAINEGKIVGAIINGTMTVDKATDNAVCGAVVGLNYGEVNKINSDIDINYTAQGSATIGGLVGVTEGGHMEFCDAYGQLAVTGQNKLVGLMIGSAKNIDVNNLAFVGETNTIDGVLFENYFGTDENVTYERMLLRDNHPVEMDPNVEKLRDKVVETMYEAATIRWSVEKEMYYDCTCLLASCHGIYAAHDVYVGMPYKHYSSNLARFKKVLDEDNYFQDWLNASAALDGHEPYVGNDCLGSIQSAWWTVSNEVETFSIQSVQPARNVSGTIPVGEWPYWVDVPANEDSKILLEEDVPIEVWYDAYAQVRKGDAYCKQDNQGSGHIRMAQENPVVVRDENGAIDGDYSYIVTVEQGAPTQLEPYYCSWRYDYQYSFESLYLRAYCPVTIAEFQTGVMEPVECKLVDGAEGKDGMTLGVIETNYNIDYVTLQIKNSKGELVFDKWLIPNMGHYNDFGAYTMGIRNFSNIFELSRFATFLREADLVPGETYNYTVTVQTTPGDVFTVKDDSFTHGSAA